MAGDALIQVERVSKRFCKSLKRCMLYGFAEMAAGMVGRRRVATSLRPEEFWAVKEVSFTLRRGECLGILGANGAGKSTLLKMLNGILIPDEGRIILRGRVGALIEVGAGFHPLLTGRENIYINGAILGMSSAEIKRKFDAIVAFSGIENFLDSPVKFYSSGMYVRLGFAIAAYLEPDVLLIDEILAVGDVGFRAQCLNHCRSLLRKSAIILISHNIQDVSRIATHAGILRQGSWQPFSTVSDAITEHQRELIKRTEQGYCAGDRLACIGVVFNEGGPVQTGKPFQLVFEMESKVLLREVWFGVALTLATGERVFAETHTLEVIEPGRFSVRAGWNCCPLGQGVYWVGLFIWGFRRTEAMVNDFQLAQVRVIDPSLDSTRSDGFLRMPMDWEVRVLPSLRDRP